MSFPRFFLILSAALFSVYAVVTFLAGMPDCYVALLGAVGALGGVFLIDYLDAERAEHDRRIAEERAATWARRMEGRR